MLCLQVAQLSKFREGGGLGISLEGTVDVENGVEVRPHHYIRSILHDGPVGVNGRLKSSDELLEVGQMFLLHLMLVSCDMIGQLNRQHFLNVTVFTKIIVGRATLKKYRPSEIYARTVRIEKPMEEVTAFLAIS